MHRLIPLKKSRAAAGMQYAMMLGLVGVVTLVGITGVGGGISTLFTSVPDKLAQATNGASLTPPPPVYDSQPDAFTFAPVSNLTAGQTVQSQTVTPTGFDTTIQVAVSGGAVLVINGTPGGASGQLSPGDTLAISGSAPASYEQSATYSLTIGNPSQIINWDVSTKTQDATPDSFSFVALNGLNPGTSQTTGQIALTGFDGPLTLNWTDPGDAVLTINGGTISGGSAPVYPGDLLVVTMPASASFSTAKTVSVTLGTVSANWVITTKPQYYASCLEILNNGASTGSGSYTIDPDGAGAAASETVYCDMTTGGGGWTVLVGNAQYSSGNFPFSPTKAGVSFSYTSGQFVARQGSSANGSCHVPHPTMTFTIPIPFSQVQYDFTGRQHNVAAAVGFRIDMGNDGSYEVQQNHCTANGQNVVCTSNYTNTYTHGSTVNSGYVYMIARACQNFSSSVSSLLTVRYLAVR